MKLLKCNLLKCSKITWALLLLSLISSCSSMNKHQQSYTTPQQTHQLTDISHLSDRERADLYEAIISADIAAANGEFEVATSYYLAAGKLSKSIDLILLAIDSATNSNDQLALLQAAELWLSIEPQEIEALIYKIGGLLAHQEIDQALETTYLFLSLERKLTEQANWLELAIKSQSPPVVNAYLTQLITKYPNSVAILYARSAFYADVAKLTKQPSQMIKQSFAGLNHALTIKPDFFPAIELKTRLLFQSRQDEKAEALLRKLHSDYPKSKQISQLLGQLLYDLHKYDLAKQHYQHWLKKNKSDDEGRFFLAASHFALAEYDKSLKQYQKILGSDYKPQATYFFCGNAASQLKQLEQASACYNLVEEGTYLTRAKIELAKIYSLQGKVDKALSIVTNPKYAVDEDAQIKLINIEIEIINKHISKEKAQLRLASALEKYPNNVSLLFKKITIDELSDKPKALVELFQRAEPLIQDENKNHQFNLSVASFLRNNHHYQQAVDWLTNALKNKPDDKEFIYARALYKEPLGLIYEMIDDFKHLLEQDPNNANLQNALGYSLADVNRELDYAELLIEKAYLAMPNNAAVVDSKGWLAFRQGDHQLALKYLNRAFKMSPSADVATHIGEVYWTTGEKEKAIEYWIIAKNIDKENYLLLNTVKKYGVELPAK